MRNAWKVFLPLLGFAFGFIIAEGMLRLLGKECGAVPVSFAPANFAYRGPFMADDKTGWQLKPGNYQLRQGGRVDTNNIIVNPDGSRATRKEGRSSFAPALLFLGDSFIFGEGLNDDETLPWKAQQLLADWNVFNFGVGGFGTCQAFLRFQQLQERLKLNGALVVYGLSSFHEERNTADPRLDYWAALTSPKHSSGYPRCRLMENALVVEPSREWPVLVPFTGKLALSKIITDFILSRRAIEMIREQRAVTEFLLLSLKRETEKQQGTFIVLLQDLTGESLSHYQEFFRKSQISYIDGTAAAKNQMRLPDGHPGPETMQVWAKQLSDYIATQDNKPRQEKSTTDNVH